MDELLLTDEVVTDANSAINALATKVNDEADILISLEVLGGAALLSGNRRLYEHIYAAKVRYQEGEWLHGHGLVT